MRADLRPRGGRAAVEADAGAAGRPVRRDAAGVGPEPLRRILRRDAALQRRAAELDRVLQEAELGEGLARGDAHLRLHEVDVGDLLGHGVLDLDAGVHLDEDGFAGARAGRLEQELHGAGVDVADRAGERDGVRGERIADRGVEVRRGCDLDDLLVPALHRAVALVEVDGLARGIREDLHLDVPRPDDGLLEEDTAVAERGGGFTRRLRDGGRQLAGGLDAPHAAAAAAGDGLHEDREADLVRLGDERVDVVGCRRGAQHGDARRDGVLLGGDLVARHLEHPRGRADEGDAVLRGARGELRILGEKAVARVDGVGAGGQRDADDLVDVEVGADRMTLLADLVRFVRLLPVERTPVLPGEHRDGARSQLEGRPECANGDLTAVRDQDLAEHLHLFPECLSVITA